MAHTREIVLDTETTGLDPKQGDRLVEIGCLELVNHVFTGETFHIYIDPQRDMPDEAFRIHGLSIDFLSQHPVFADQVDDFLAFIGDSPLVIHNASFDMKFLNAELRWLNKPEIPMSRAIDTLLIARKKFPGAPANLDALCRRFGIDNSGRTLHGALLDSELLADVYLELIGGKQPGLGLAPAAMTPSNSLGGRAGASSGAGSGTKDEQTAKPSDSQGTQGAKGAKGAKGANPTRQGVRKPRPHGATAKEREAHQEFVKGLKDPIWDKYPGRKP